MKLWQYIRENLLRYPNKKFMENDTYMTYEEVVVFAETFARKLYGEKCCAIYCNSEMAASIGLLACFAAEVTAVPLSSRYGERHCLKIIETVFPTCILTDSGSELKIERTGDSRYIAPQKHPAVIMFTSGTSGVPKGVMLSEKNLITNVNDISEYFKVNAGDTILISRPVYHAAVLTGEFLLSIIKGMDIVFYSQAFNPKLIVDILKKYKITTFAGTPTILTMLSDILRDINLYSIKNIVVSGECMQKDTAEKLLQNYKGVNIYHVYGLTEASPRVSYLEPALFKSHPCSVGVPLKSVEIKILDDSGLPVDDRQEGILWIKGESVMLGYYNMPELTASKLRGRWLCTGDIAYFKDNMLYIKCRSDDLIIRAGMNIYPQEIESELKKDTRVKEVLVYGCQSKFGTQIVLEICGDFNSEKEVIKLFSERLSPYQIPQTVRIVKSIAKSASGKVIRHR